MKSDGQKRSAKIMWGCRALFAVAIVLLASGIGGGGLFLIPCMLMMGMMVWMMMGGMRRNSRARDKT